MSGNQPLLSIRDLSIEFETPSGPFSAVRNLSLDLEQGKTLAIVGESGSGKSTIAASINGLLAGNGRVTSGSILFEGRNLANASEAVLRSVRGAGIGLVPQDPMSNLNPLHRVGKQIREALEVHGRARGREADQMVVDLLRMVGIPEPERRARQYAHELSGGMRQRVLIAMGLACRPRLLIADEPTSALDVTMQRVILDELQSLTSRLGTAVILITHDLALAAERADNVLVMFRGDPVEYGPARQVLSNPGHDYTRQLLSAAPNLTSRRLIPAEVAPDVQEDRPQTRSERYLVELVGLRKEYPIKRGLWGKPGSFVALEGSTLEIPRRKTVAIVGESGSGKSTTAKLLLKIEEATAGNIVFDGREITRLSAKELLEFRRRVQPVFQNPFASLDGRYTIAESIREPLLLHNIGDPASQRKRVLEVLDQVALPATLAERLPHELSGGQRQRVAIARALVLKPELVVLDEAVSALDVIVQAQILELLAKLQAEFGLSYLFISHDLAVVRMIAHQVHVMHKGHIVESGTPDELFRNPSHAYTRQLISAIPGQQLQEDRGAEAPADHDTNVSAQLLRL